jgi:hypothetical protein
VGRRRRHTATTTLAPEWPAPLQQLKWLLHSRQSKQQTFQKNIDAVAATHDRAAAHVVLAMMMCSSKQWWQ